MQRSAHRLRPRLRPKSFSAARWRPQGSRRRPPPCRGRPLEVTPSTPVETSQGVYLKQRTVQGTMYMYYVPTVCTCTMYSMYNYSMHMYMYYVPTVCTCTMYSMYNYSMHMYICTLCVMYIDCCTVYSVQCTSRYSTLL